MAYEILKSPFRNVTSFFFDSTCQKAEDETTTTTYDLPEENKQMELKKERLDELVMAFFKGEAWSNSVLSGYFSSIIGELFKDDSRSFIEEYFLKNPEILNHLIEKSSVYSLAKMFADLLINKDNHAEIDQSTLEESSKELYVSIFKKLLEKFIENDDSESRTSILSIFKHFSDHGWKLAQGADIAVNTLFTDFSLLEKLLAKCCTRVDSFKTAGLSLRRTRKIFQKAVPAIIGFIAKFFE